MCRHCSIRWVWVNVPAFSTCVAAGKKNTSVSMSSVRSSPVAISGPSFQKVADSIMFEIADHQPLQVRHAHPLHPAVRRTDGRVLAEQEVALDLVVEHVHHGLVRAVRRRSAAGR